MKKSRIFIKIDPYDRITACNRTLIVFHLYCCSEHKFSHYTYSKYCETLLVFVCFCEFYLYDWVTIMGYSKHKISSINMLFFLKKIRHITLLPPHNGHLLPFPRWPLWRSSTVPYLTFFFPKDADRLLTPSLALYQLLSTFLHFNTALKSVIENGIASEICKSLLFLCFNSCSSLPKRIIL